MSYDEKQKDYSLKYAREKLKRIPLDVKKEYYIAKLHVFEQEFLLSKDPEAKNRL